MPTRGSHSPKSPLDAADVVLKPVALGHLFLTNRHAGPLDAHNRDAVGIVLVKLDLQRRVVAGGPLVQTPALNNLGGLLQLQVLARDVAVEDLKLAALLGPLKDLGRGAGEGGDPLGVCEGLVELLGSGAELLVVAHRGRVDDGAGLGLRARRGRRLGRSTGRGVELGGGEAARRVRVWRVLDVLAVLGDKGGGELDKLAPQLGNELGAHQVLDRLLLLGLGMDVDVKLSGVPFLVGRYQWRLREAQHTTNSSSVSSWETSGTVMVPETSSSSAAVEPGEHGF